jgi:hypothetical protein
MLTECPDTEVWWAALLEQACKPFFLYEISTEFENITEINLKEAYVRTWTGLNLIIVSCGEVRHERLQTSHHLKLVDQSDTHSSNPLSRFYLI